MFIQLLAVSCFVLVPQTGSRCFHAKIAADDRAYGDGFGIRDLEGDTLLAGSPGAASSTNSNAGAAYVFHRDDGGTPADPRDDTWIQVDKFRAGKFSASFGAGGALEGPVAVIGATREPANEKPGWAFVFGRDDKGNADPLDDTWEEILQLGPVSTTRDFFGAGVVFEGDTVLVSAPFDDELVENAGAVYHYDRDDNMTPSNPFDDTWTQVSKIDPGDPVQHGSFGLSMALEGDTLVVGATQASPDGAIYFFQRDRKGTGDPLDDAWIEIDRVTASETTSETLGSRLSVSGGRVLAGAYRTEVSGISCGKVFVFVRDDRGTVTDPFDDRWIETHSFAASDPVEKDFFGLGVTQAGDLAVVASPRNDEYGLNVGAAYVFALDDMGTPDPLDDRFVEVEKMLPVDGEQSDHFGSPVFFGDELFIGSNDESAGAIYAYAFAYPCPGYLGVRNGRGVNAVCVEAPGPAIVGSLWKPWIDTGHHPGALLSFLEARDRPLTPPLRLGFGDVFIDLLSGNRIFRVLVASDPNGTDTFSFQIPPDPAWIGFQFFVQGGILGGQSGAEVCNALDVVIG